MQAIIQDLIKVKFFFKKQSKSGLIKVNWQITPEHLLTLSSVYGIHKGWEPWAAKRCDVETNRNRNKTLWD